MEVAAARRQLEHLLVQDLKDVLGRLNQSRSGRKDELKRRILSFLNAGDPVLASKTAAIISDYYRRKTLGSSPTSGTYNEPYYNTKPPQLVNPMSSMLHSGNAMVSERVKTVSARARCATSAAHLSNYLLQPRP